MGDEPPNDIACCMSSDCFDRTDSQFVVTNMFNIVASPTCNIASLHPTSSKLSYCASPIGATDHPFEYYVEGIMLVEQAPTASLFSTADLDARTVAPTTRVILYDKMLLECVDNVSYSSLSVSALAHPVSIVDAVPTSYSKLCAMLPSSSTYEDSVLSAHILPPDKLLFAH